MTERKQRRLALLLGALAGAMALVTGYLMARPLPASEPRTAPAVFGVLPEEALLDLNSATAEELECLPGVGPVTAEAIIQRREELGAFVTEEDVLSVPGLGEGTYEKMRPYITYQARKLP